MIYVLKKQFIESYNCQAIFYNVVVYGLLRVLSN